MNLLKVNGSYLLAFSGGIDSVVMADLLFQTGIPFSIAHVNFSLRGDESKGDQLFAEGTAGKYQVPFYTINFNTSKIASDQKKGIQEVARELRYNWFQELVNTHNFDAVLTAHHANDNIETLWMNLLRGTGLQGLSGMKMKEGGIHGNIIRPFLFATKNEIIQFAEENDLKWRQDSSNADIEYTRNLLRNNILPIIDNAFPSASVNMLQNIERIQDVNKLYQYLTDKYIKKWILVKGEEIHMPVLKIIKTPGYGSLMYHIFSRYSFSASQIQEAISLLQADTGRYIQNETYRIIRNRAWLILSPLKSPQTIGAVIQDSDTFIKTDSFELKIEWADKNTAASKIPNVATLDAKELQFPLLIRKWKKGDYFYPFGMNKKKKLSDFFINQKLSLSDKEKVWVLESANRIVWVMGIRIDNRFGITDATQKIIRLTFTEN